MGRGDTLETKDEVLWAAEVWIPPGIKHTVSVVLSVPHCTLSSDLRIFNHKSNTWIFALRLPNIAFNRIHVRDFDHKHTRQRRRRQRPQQQWRWQCQCKLLATCSWKHRGQNMLRELSMATTICKRWLQQDSIRFIQNPVGSLSISVYLGELCAPACSKMNLEECPQTTKNFPRLSGQSPAWYSLLEGLVRRSHILSLR